jgi:hypothetical protein
MTPALKPNPVDPARWRLMRGFRRDSLKYLGKAEPLAQPVRHLCP